VGIKRRDVQSSLAEMDRKLRELQRELAMVSRPPDQAAPPEPARADPAPPPAPTPEAPNTIADAEAEAQAIVADARAEAARIVEEAAAGVAAIAGQIEEFQRLREELQHSATALIEEYERALRRGPPPGSAPEGEATPAPPTSPLALQHQPQPPAPPPPTPPLADGRQFEGQLVINVGPFTDIATLGTFEQALAQLPQTEDVYVRGFEGNRALVDLKLNGPVPLLDELRRVLPFDLGLVEIGYGRITIDVESPPEAPR
jgi:hypothetical protein